MRKIILNKLLPLCVNITQCIIYINVTTMNVRKFILLTLLLGIIIPVSAQVTDPEETLKKQSTVAEDGWKTGGVTNLNFSQVYFSNWAAGGLNSYSLNGLVSVFASYKKNSLTWDNTLDMGYGFLYQDEENVVSKYRKTDDKFDLTSKVGYKAFSDFYYSALVNFKTQFAEGFDYKVDDFPVISNIFSPAYFTGAIGLSYQPNSYFSAFLAPVTARLTFVSQESLRERYSLDIDKFTRTEFGGYLRTVFSKNDFKAPVLKNITLTSKLDLFSNYLDKPQNIDVSWEVLIAMKINKYLSVNISTHLIYDYDIKFKEIKNGVEKEVDKVQFKELLGVGFSYNF